MAAAKTPTTRASATGENAQIMAATYTSQPVCSPARMPSTRAASHAPHSTAQALARA